ncbi:MAG: DUF268 domain-containing protein [Chloroflexota bacterium]
MAGQNVATLVLQRLEEFERRSSSDLQVGMELAVLQNRQGAIADQQRAEIGRRLAILDQKATAELDQLRTVIVSRLDEFERHSFADVQASTELAAIKRREAIPHDLDGSTLRRLLRIEEMLESIESREGDIARQLEDLASSARGLGDDEAGIARRLQLLLELGQALDRRVAEERSTLHSIESLVGMVNERSVDSAAQELVDRPLNELGSGAAALLNYAISHRGFAAQAGLWFNPPLWVEHRAGDVVIGGMNERIVEVPYVTNRIGTLPPGSKILDFGAAESTVALSLASLGYNVTALDLHPYPVQHSRITSVACPAQEWEGPHQPLDAVISLSTLEHVGLGAYGENPTTSSLDRLLIERFARWLKPGGILVLTAPFGEWAIDTFQRTYDRDHLDNLLKGWRVLDLRYAVNSQPLRWDTTETEPMPASFAPDTRAIVLLTATPV